MKCHDIRQTFGVYWDLAEDDPDRLLVNEHIDGCQECMEEFKLWEESERLIRSLSELDEVIGPVDHVNRGVMDRIYAEEAWYMPVPSRSHQFSRAFRRNAAVAIACCMAMFICGLFYMVTGNQDASTDMAKLTGMLEPVNAVSQSGMVGEDIYAEIPVASISDPIVLKVVPTFPQYWVALSILGMIMALLILNWLSRTRH